MSGNQEERPTTLSDLLPDELVRYGHELGLNLRARTPRGELLRCIRARQELLLELDREAMLDVVVWARRPVRRSASKEDLARHIAHIGPLDYRGLSRRGLAVLARLRGLPAAEEETEEAIIKRLERKDGLWRRLRRRPPAGGMANVKQEGDEYRFLPEADSAARAEGPPASRGIVGGIAGRIRGVADDYVREKLDEIEARIDGKLDEIDARLCEWRDREVANRLKIIKITLVASILVALLSLGYKYVQHWYLSSTPEETRPAETRR